MSSLQLGDRRGRSPVHLWNLPKARTAPDKTAIERQIAATDKQIDALVYELYGLTEEEIRIVEGD